MNHEFVIRIGDLNSSVIWREYLSHKNSHILFAVGEEEEEISRNLDGGIDRFESWRTNTEYSLTDANPCVYLSSLGVNNNTMYAKVLNICEDPQEFTLNFTHIMGEVLITESPMRNESIEFRKHGELFFEVCSNSGKSVVQYPKAFTKGKVSPFSFNAYEIHHVCALYHEIDKPKSVTMQIVNVILNKTIEYSTDEDFMLIFYLGFLISALSALFCISFYLVRKRSEKKFI